MRRSCFHPRKLVEQARKCEGETWQEKKAAYRALKRQQELDYRAMLARQDLLAMEIGRSVLNVMARHGLR